MSKPIQLQAKVNAAILAQHAEEAVGIYGTRTILTDAAQVNLDDLHRFDERLAAHLDGLAIGGDHSWPACDALLEAPSAGALYAATVRAIDTQHAERLTRSLALAEAMPEISSGLRAAFGWSGRDKLQGIVARLLADPNAFPRSVGIAACAMHRVDPGVTALVRDDNPAVRARALRTAGELGMVECLSATLRSMGDDDLVCRYFAARAAVLLGNRDDALTNLTARIRAGGPNSRATEQLVLLALPVGDAYKLLRQSALESAPMRSTIRGAAYCGDPNFVPWLISRMADNRHARIAGESFAMIVGVNLAQAALQRETSPDFAAAASDDPEVKDVDMDEDDGLPWPDQAKIQAWWNQYGQRFTTGVRHFMGRPPNRTHCIQVLKNGYQRQRITAAYHLCLLNPGTPLFEWRAPAGRQQRELAEMT